MAKQIIRALVALLATPILVACGSLQSAGSSASNDTKPSQAPVTVVGSAPVAPQGAPAAKQSATQGKQVVGQFPTSSKPAKNQWTMMHKDGFVGNFKEAGKLLGLTPAEVQKYEEMHMAGACTLMDVPNGVVLDGLTFTDRKNKKPKVQHGAKVMLVDAKDRSTQVCDLGGGTIALKFNGCGNHAIVRGWKPVKATVAPAPAPKATAPASCPAKTIAISVWEAKASTFACAGPARVKELGDTSPFGSGHVSRECGPDFRKAFLKDDLKMVSSPTKLTMSHLRGGKVVRTLYDAVPPASEVRVGLPADFRPGDSIRIVPESHTGLWSPLIKPMQSADWEFDHCVTLHSFVVK